MDIVKKFLLNNAIKILTNTVGILVHTNNILAPGFITCI